MKSLVDFINESLLDDFDDLSTKQDDFNKIQEFFDLLKNDNIYDADKLSINDKGEIVVSDYGRIWINHNIPSYIRFRDNDRGSFSINGQVEDMISFENLDFLILRPDCKIKKYRKLQNLKAVHIEGTDIDNFSWLPKTLSKLIIKSGYVRSMPIETIDLENIHIETFELLIQKYIKCIKNINCDNLKINDCSALKTIENCKVNNNDPQSFYLTKCDKLESFKGDCSFECVYVDATLKKFDPTTFPKNLKIIFNGGKLGAEWMYSNLSNYLPNLDETNSSLPSKGNFKALNNKEYKPGVWIVVRSKRKASGARGELTIDKIKKINQKTGGITTEENGPRSPIDFEIMRDANLHKDWKYVDANGINDITGVGIQVGDEVIVYGKSGGFGTNHGIEVDKVIQITKSRVKCETNGIRPPHDICIIRSQKLCDEQFK